MKLTFELWFTRCVSLKDVYWQGVLFVIAIIVLLVTYVIPVHHVLMTIKSLASSNLIGDSTKSPPLPL